MGKAHPKSSSRSFYVACFEAFVSIFAKQPFATSSRLLRKCA